VDADCVLCKKLSTVSEIDVVWRFPHGVAVLGPWQYYHGYCMLIASCHATELNQLPDAVRRAHLDEMCLLAQAIEKCFRPHKLNYELLGNQVPHLHWHLFPRYKEDPDRLQPVWLALDRAERDPELRCRLETGPKERAVTVAALQDQLKNLNAPRA
jgi:diadenosine tetraphosphate (Ap4A) HIT family hydrolase